MKYLSLLGYTGVLVFFADVAVAKSPAEIEQIARSVSVEIQVVGQDFLRNGKAERVGSGVIIHRKGDLYTLITNRHVACGTPSCRLPTTQTYQLRTADGQRYRVPVKGVKLLGEDLDLAVVQFRSSRSYQIAQVATPDSLKVDDAVYSAGFPAEQGWRFRSGEAQAVVNKRLVGDDGGYTVIYNTETLPGMSGGGAFDQDGKLIAVHGKGDRVTENTQAEEVSSNLAKAEVNSKTGYNRGIPIRWVVQGLGELGILVRNSNQIKAANPAIAATADEYFIAGFNKFVEPGTDFQVGRREAVAQFSRAIMLNPRYIIAYFMRAYVQDDLQAYPQAIADYNKAISLNPNYVLAYNNRGNLKNEKLNDPQGALADFNQAINLNSKFVLAYSNRGVLKNEKLNDSQGALADFNQAISLNPNYAFAYNNRGILKTDKLNDSQGALADYNKAISLNSKFVLAYNNRGVLKTDKLNDSQGALADYNKAISLNPKFVLAYSNRGVLKSQKFNDYQGALADFNLAVTIDAKNVNALYNRGDFYYAQGNFSGATNDFRQVTKISPNSSNSLIAQGVITLSQRQPDRKSVV